MKQTHSNSKKVVIFSILLVLILGTFVIILFNKQPKATSGPIKTIEQPKTDATQTTPSVSPDKPSTVSSSVQNTSGKLIAPYGTLISNHRPGQNGSNLIESSQCTTTPGAKCFIKFTQGSVVNTLPEKTTDSDGSIFWEWNVTDAGLTEGDWVVTAVASLSGQTKSTTDQLNLEVQ